MGDFFTPGARLGGGVEAEGSQPHTVVHGACGHQFACNIHTRLFVHIRVRCEMQVWASVSFSSFLIVCVCSPKAHGFSVIEHNPASLNNKSHWTRKCTGSPAGRESNSRWYRIGSVEIQHELKARHWRLLMMFLWNYTGCPQLTEHSTATDDDDDELLLWRFFFFPPRCVTVYPCACVHACGLTRRTCQNLIVGNELRWGGGKKKKTLDGHARSDLL